MQAGSEFPIALMQGCWTNRRCSVRTAPPLDEHNRRLAQMTHSNIIPPTRRRTCGSRSTGELVIGD